MAFPKNTPTLKETQYLTWFGLNAYVYERRRSSHSPHSPTHPSPLLTPRKTVSPPQISHSLWLALLYLSNPPLSLHLYTNRMVDGGAGSTWPACANSFFTWLKVGFLTWPTHVCWLHPSHGVMISHIPNKDFLDGTELQFKSVTVGKYLCAEQGGGTIIVANRTSASGWETFKRINETSFQFRVLNKQFMGLNYTTGNGIDVVAIANTSSETFQIVRNSDDLSRVRIKAPNGFFLQVKTEERVAVDSKGDGGWGDSDPSVFIMTISRRLQGEYQLTHGYGPLKASQVMRDHWRTFIVEEDFKFISKNGINAVRIPVGWWIASDPKPPHPYIGGSLKALDHAFLWSSSQNGFEHRDGCQEWRLSEQNIQQTIDVIDFLTARYANNPSLYAVELINEPLAPGASLDSIIKYYKAGYEVVRKHSKTAYVVMSNRLRQADPKELFPLASGLERTVIDVHYYNLFSDVFNNMTVQQNINFINTN
ncbi:unnamed protein product [Camellia sinensis]